MTHQQAKQILNEHLHQEGSTNIAGPATRDRRWGVWVVVDRDPHHPGEMLVGGAYAVTDDGTVHTMGSAPEALNDLMMSLGASPAETDAWEREGEGLTLLADLDLHEARELAAYADERHRGRHPGRTPPA